jgi:hypothetical protein
MVDAHRNVTFTGDCKTQALKSSHTALQSVGTRYLGTRVPARTRIGEHMTHAMHKHWVPVGVIFQYTQRLLLVTFEKAHNPRGAANGEDCASNSV